MRHNSVMSVKAMIDLFIDNYLKDETWDMLYSMTNHGLISWGNWYRFRDTCKNWTFKKNDPNSVIDETGKVIFRLDEYGLLNKE